jgi:hypothetical protein
MKLSFPISKKTVINFDAVFSAYFKLGLNHVPPTISDSRFCKRPFSNSVPCFLAYLKLGLDHVPPSISDSRFRKRRLSTSVPYFGLTSNSVWMTSQAMTGLSRVSSRTCEKTSTWITKVVRISYSLMGVESQANATEQSVWCARTDRLQSAHLNFPSPSVFFECSAL